MLVSSGAILISALVSATVAGAAQKSIAVIAMSAATAIAQIPKCLVLVIGHIIPHARAQDKRFDCGYRCIAHRAVLCGSRTLAWRWFEAALLDIRQKQNMLFRRKGESSVGGADNRTCLTANAERGHRGAVRERAAHGNDGVVCAGSKSRIGTEKSPSKSARAFGAECRNLYEHCHVRRKVTRRRKFPEDVEQVLAAFQFAQRLEIYRRMGTLA